MSAAGILRGELVPPSANPLGTNAAAPSISVVISAYTEDRWDSLMRAIESVRAQTLVPLETIIVIDHNVPLRERAARHLACVPDCRVVDNTEEQGLSGARNTGVAVAGGDVVAFLDDDAVADHEWLERLRAHYADPRVLGVGGAIEPLWLSGRPKSFPPEFDWVVGCTYRGHPETTGPVRNLIGANMSFRRSVIQAVGGFRSDIGRVGTRPIGGRARSCPECEETEFCLRTASRWPHGLIIYEPRARIVHIVTAARGSWAYFFRRCYDEGLSKAVIGRLAGSSDGLSSERTYVLRSVSRGVAANIAVAILRGDGPAFARAVRMVVGLSAATAGYCVGAALSLVPSRH